MTEADDKKWEVDYDGLPRYLDALSAWFHAEQLKAYFAAVLPDGERRLFLGILVYGSYVERFLKFCVPSLLAAGNLDAIRGGTMVVHTDAASVDALCAGLVEIVRRGVAVEIEIVPQHILDMVPEKSANKYWLLGAAHALHMQMAKYRAHAYHMLMPDVVYATGYFANVVRLRDAGHHVIIQGALSAVLEDAAPDLLEAECALAPERLNALALDKLHPEISVRLMNGRADYPGNMFLPMIGEREARLYSPHMSLVYLAHEVLMKAPVRIFNTIDTQIPWFAEGFDIYVPTPDDGMAFIEISDRGKAWRLAPGHSIEEFCARFWIMIACNPAYLELFKRPTILRFPDGYTPPMAPMTEAEMDALAERTMATIGMSRQLVYDALPPAFRMDPIERERQRLAEQEKGNT